MKNSIFDGLARECRELCSEARAFGRARDKQPDGSTEWWRLNSFNKDRAGRADGIRIALEAFGFSNPMDTIRMRKGRK